MYNIFFDGHQKHGDMTLTAARSIARDLAHKAVTGTRRAVTWTTIHEAYVHDALHTYHLIKIVEVQPDDERGESTLSDDADGYYAARLAGIE